MDMQKEVIVYKPFKEIRKEDAEKEYRDTGVVFLTDFRGERFKAFGQLPYVAGKNESYYMGIFAKNAELKDICENLVVLIVQPVVRSQFLENGNSYGERMLFSQFFGTLDDYIAMMTKKYMRLFGVSESDVTIYAKVDMENERAIYYGISIENLSGSVVGMSDAQFEREVEKYSVSNYIKMKKGYAERMKKILNFGSCEANCRENDEQSDLEGSDDKQRLIAAIKKWLKKVSFREFSDVIAYRVKGQEDVKLVAINVYNYLRNIANSKKINNNMLIAAPSGCGKTETYRAIRDYFKKEIPKLVIAQVDMTSITEEGFKGKDVKDMIRPLLSKSSLDGIGILFCDEFDKKLLPSYTSQGNDVNAAVQAQILTIVEGTEASYIIDDEEKKIDTGNALFIGLGAFDMCRKKKTNVEKHMGFGAENEGGADHYDNITRQDMMDIGASYELLGRFPFIINYRKLDDNTIYEIIDCAVKEQEESLDCTIMLTDNARKQLLDSANSQYGCRIIKSKLQEAIMPPYIKLMYEDSEEKVIILNEIEA